MCRLFLGGVSWRFGGCALSMSMSWRICSMSSSKVLTRLPVAVTLLSMAAMLVLMPPMSSLVAKGFIMRANRASMAAMLGSMGGGAES